MPSADSSDSDPGHGVLRVGITGHRLGGLAQADPPVLRARVRKILARLKTRPNGLEVISPLAEGADRIVAEEGLALGASLYVPLPIPQSEYEQDFGDSTSVEDFRALLSKAREVEILPGLPTPQDARNEAYAAVGKRVVELSDLLIAIWNGSPAAGRGGTAEIIEFARDTGVPVIWIRAFPPHEATLLEPPAALFQIVEFARKAVSSL